METNKASYYKLYIFFFKNQNKNFKKNMKKTINKIKSIILKKLHSLIHFKEIILNKLLIFYLFSEVQALNIVQLFTTEIWMHHVNQMSLFKYVLFVLFWDGMRKNLNTLQCKSNLPVKYFEKM